MQVLSHLLTEHHGNGRHYYSVALLGGPVVDPSLVLGHLNSCVVCGCCTFCGLTHTTWRSGQWISESPIDHHHFWIVPCSTIRFLWLAKVKPLPSSRNGCLRLCPRHNRRSKPPEPKRSDPNGTSRVDPRGINQGRELFVRCLHREGVFKGGNYGTTIK